MLSAWVDGPSALVTLIKAIKGEGCFIKPVAALDELRGKAKTNPLWENVV